MLNIALFGPPGAGKGTQSSFLISRYNLFYISTGDLLRKEMAENSPLGQEARELIASGGLVPDEIIVQIIEKTITEHPNANGFLFDGFPRTALQAYILEGLMIKLHTSLTCLISLAVPEDISVQRLLDRGKHSGRMDDNQGVIRNRLREYHQKTLAVLDFYRERGIIHTVDGSAGIEQVSASIEKIIRGELGKNLLNIVIFGAPGSGRGSQGKALARQFDLEYIATGELLEQEMRSGSPHAEMITQLYETGQLVPDEIVIPLLEKKLTRSTGVRGYIFKGIPRTLVQSYILDGLLQQRDLSAIKIIELVVPTEQLIERLVTRSGTDRRMPYDTSRERILERLHTHERYTVPVIRKYNQLHGVTTIDGTGTFDEVFSRVASEVENGLISMR